MTITIYHNPACSKSRKTLEIIESRGITPRIVRYLDEPPEAELMLQLAAMLGVPLRDILRTSEADFVAAGGAVPIGDSTQLAAWLHDHPRVLQRPIVVNETSGQAVIGRPPENVMDIL